MAADNPFESFALKMEHMAAELDAKMPDVIATSIMVELEAQHKQRIFGEGRKSDGSKIGEYSKKSGYYSKKKFVRKGAFKPQGKDDVGVDENGKKKARLTYQVVDSYSGKKKTIAYVKSTEKNRKTMYLAEGYSEFRDIQGRQTDHVDWKLTGSLERSIGVVKLADAVLYGVRDAEESKKLEGLTERYGDVASLSESEKELTKQEITNQAIVVMKEYGK